jgi:hypothetical protein
MRLADIRRTRLALYCLRPHSLARVAYREHIRASGTRSGDGGRHSQSRLLRPQALVRFVVAGGGLLHKHGRDRGHGVQVDFILVVIHYDTKIEDMHTPISHYLNHEPPENDEKSSLKRDPRPRGLGLGGGIINGTI